MKLKGREKMKIVSEWKGRGGKNKKMGRRKGVKGVNLFSDNHEKLYVGCFVLSSHSLSLYIIVCMYVWWSICWRKNIKKVGSKYERERGNTKLGVGAR